MVATTHLIKKLAMSFVITMESSQSLQNFFEVLMGAINHGKDAIAKTYFTGLQKPFDLFYQPFACLKLLYV